MSGYATGLAAEEDALADSRSLQALALDAERYAVSRAALAAAEHGLDLEELRDMAEALLKPMAHGTSRLAKIARAALVLLHLTEGHPHHERKHDGDDDEHAGRRPEPGEGSGLGAGDAGGAGNEALQGRGGAAPDGAGG